MVSAAEGMAFIGLSLCGILTVAHAASVGLAAWHIGGRGPTSSFPAGAPVSVVRPVRGLETFSEETLRSGFDLDYPAFELIFCVADADDPVVPLLCRLMDAHPEVAARLLIGDERISDNPKLNNCVRGWAEARHDWVVLADSNLLMPADYLQRLQAAWRPSTGLVCSTPIGARPDGFLAEVECAFLNTLQARWQYAGAAIGLGFAQGKSMLWHKPFLEAHGGIAALAAEIAEDAAATKLVRATGRQVHLVGVPFLQPLGRRSVREVWDRQMRWARLRRITFPNFFAPEILSGPLLPFLVAALCLRTASAITFILVLTVLWYGVEYALAVSKDWPRSPRLVLAFVVRDTFIPALWLCAWVRTGIVWRGNAMIIRAKERRVLPGWRQLYAKLRPADGPGSLNLP